MSLSLKQINHFKSQIDASNFDHSLKQVLEQVYQLGVESVAGVTNPIDKLFNQLVVWDNACVDKKWVSRSDIRKYGFISDTSDKALADKLKSMVKSKNLDWEISVSNDRYGTDGIYVKF